MTDNEVVALVEATSNMDINSKLRPGHPRPQLRYGQWRKEKRRGIAFSWGDGSLEQAYLTALHRGQGVLEAPTPLRATPERTDRLYPSGLGQRIGDRFDPSAAPHARKGASVGSGARVYPTQRQWLGSPEEPTEQHAAITAAALALGWSDWEFKRPGVPASELAAHCYEVLMDKAAGREPQLLVLVEGLGPEWLLDENDIPYLVLADLTWPEAAVA